MQDFVHLHVHTYYSILDGQSSIKKLVDKAVDDGQRGMAITDHGNMFGIKEFYNYCKKKNKELKSEGKAPFKPIFGCEMYVAHRKKTDKVKDKGDLGGYHLIVLAKNYNGYKNLIKLVSRSWVDGYYSRPRTDREDLETYHQDLIVCSACIAGEVPAKILSGKMDEAREAVQWYKRVFGDDYYLELQRHEVKDPQQRANRETFPLQQQANKILVEFAKEYGIKLVSTNDVHFVDEENAEAHDHLLCLSTGKDLDDPTRLLYSKQEWFKTISEMNEVFPDYPEALSNTIEILDKVEAFSIDHDPIMPFFPIPKDFGTEEDVRKKYSPEELYKEFTTDENGENPLSREEGEKKIKHLGGIEKLYRIKFEADYLSKLTYDGALRLYGNPLPEDISQRIKFELHVMKTMGFPGYFLIVQDFINTARDELGVMVGPGRGSAAGSVVAYCLGITRIDPIKYDLLFERFLNPDRISLPDIDTDFDDEGRGKVLEWVENKYGKDKVAHIITYAAMLTKNSIRDVARVEKLPLSVANHLCKAIPERLPGDLKMNLTNAIKSVPELSEAEVSENPLLRNTIKYAKMLEGTVRGTGIHACGTIICRDDISDWVPVSTAEDKSTSGRRVLTTQYDGHVIEETGLIKMDFLGLTTLSILKETLENIKVTRGIEIDIENIPLDDELTYKLYQEGRTIGTFQFESAGMQKYLRELKPTVFEDLIAMNALYRPGPMENIPSFIARKNGKERISYDIPCMEKYLKETYGITVYQEQVMLLSRELAGFTRGESDQLRKAMGKKKKEIVDQMKPKFIQGGIANGHDPKVLEKIWGDWEKFASYAFNKSHATCYSWVSYQTAYLKAHYPAEFMAGNLSQSLDDIKKITKLMVECQNMGIPCLGPDVNESRGNFSANKKGEIRFGLAAIKGVGEAASQAIISERERRGAFKDIFDLMQRVNLTILNSKAIEGLVLSGALDSMNVPRESYFFVGKDGRNFIETLTRYGQLYQQEKKENLNSLFGDMDVEISTPAIPKVEAWSQMEKLSKERYLVGIYLSAHPLDEYDFILNDLCNTKCTELEGKEALAIRKDICFGGIVVEIRTKFMKNGKPCGFVKIEDFSGQGELALFGEDWARFSGMLTEGSTIMVKAQMIKRFKDSDAVDLKVTDIQYLQSVKENLVSSLIVTLNASKIDETIVSDFVSIVNEFPGKTPLHVQFVDGDSSYPLMMRSRSNKVDLSKRLISFIQETDALDYRISYPERL
ncbi:MAG: DNA polymerase III subunit alpha [Prevotella sp.]|nr:DNA polymerase III subunit alpha [Prevotella sp.]